MLDLDKIIERHLTKDKMEGRTFYDGHIVIDLFECVEEIKQLRSALTTMQGAYELGVGTERDDVVAWLRKSHEIARNDNDDGSEDAVSWAYFRSASCIERGAHKKKDNESP
jgi:hypothetical protein